MAKAAKSSLCVLCFLGGLGVVTLASQSCTVKQSETPDLLGPSSLTTPPPPAPPTAQFVFNPSAPALSTPVAFDGRSSCPEAGFAGFCVNSDRAITSYTWDFGDGTTGSGATASHVYRTLGSFNVSLTVVSDRGLSSTASRSVPIGVGGTPPTAGFVFSPTNPTIGQSVSFNAATSKGGTTGIANYSWDFGDGGRAGGSNPTHSFSNAGTYIVLLIVTDEAGQTATATQSVPVQINSSTPLPTADFVFSPIAATTGQSVSFNASLAKAATGHTIVEYSWNFGDGGTGSGVTPSHSFGTAGTYSVVLVVKDDLGQTGTASKTVPVSSNSPSPPPTADFVFSPTNPIVAQSVSFNAALSKAATGRTISSYAWNFGDGGASGTGVNPSRTFANTGTFSVVLTVTDDIGQSATVAKTVTVTATPSDPPTASFVFSPGSPQVNQAVLFDATQSTVAAGHTLSYAWNFGDSLTGTGVTPSHTYTAAGTYSVVLKVTDNTTLQTATTTRSVAVTSTGQPPTADFVFSPAAPQVNQSVLFDATASTVAQGHALSYAWNFGDNGTGTGVTPNHPYTSAGTFSVVLKVTDTTTGQTATATKAVTVSSTGSTAPPTASFVFSPQSPATAQLVSFNATQSTAAAGHSIVSYAWNFGDGGTATGVTTTHPFANAGTFSVVLVVTDDLGQTGTTTRSVTVSSTSPTPPPTASFVFSPTAPVTNQTVSFNATQSSASAGHTITSYAWNFGDGTTGTGVTPTHPYATAGSFSVVLVVTDDLGQTGTTTNTVAVSLGPPTASFVFSPTSPGTNQDVFFNASASTAAPGRSIASYAWEFGDGTSPGSGVTPTHAYNRSGTFTVSLLVTDNTGQQGSTSRTVTVSTTSSQIVAEFTSSPSDPLVGQSVNFDATPSIPSTGATITSWVWDFGDGGTGSGQKPTHPFLSLNTFVVRLTVTDSAGKTATVTHTVTTK